MEPTPQPSAAQRAAQAKARLSEKLNQLAQRVEGFREAAKPMELLTKPWALFAIGFVTGLALGRRRSRTSSTTTALAPVRPSITGAIVREVLIVAAGTWTRRYLHKALSAEPRDPRWHG